jgi:YEATS domain-containing protein 4
VSETGWGEFEIQIRIYFNDLTEKPVTLYHGLKLFHTNEAITSQAMIQV